jgi:pimeloyl-ACP methyl ester carboxylesterase
VVVEPSDPELTYWWGHAEDTPEGPAAGEVKPYTARRVLALLEWVLRRWPETDPGRVYLEGASMGGAGALELGLLHARHFAGVVATQAQTVARLHRPYRQRQLSKLWGPPEVDLPGGEGLGVWSRLDMTRALRDEAEARQQHVVVLHGKDDSTIHFGAAVGRSLKTGLSFYEALQRMRVGHVAAWDEGGHVQWDPERGGWWWWMTWTYRQEGPCGLRRGRAFAAFSHSSWDGNPGEGRSNGRQPWRDDAGYAGRPEVAGDTGWDGDVAGMINDGLCWDPWGVEDTHERLALPLRAVPPPGQRAPAVVDVTPRRVQRFQCLPGETVRWRFGEATGTVVAAEDGSVTVPRLKLGEAWEVLVLEREPTLEVPPGVDVL